MKKAPHLRRLSYGRMGSESEGCVRGRSFVVAAPTRSCV
nr:MAG TPA: hypothetical protein [Caudoviricetes sp.]